MSPPKLHSSLKIWSKPICSGTNSTRTLNVKSLSDEMQTCWRHPMKKDVQGKMLPKSCRIALGTFFALRLSISVSKESLPLKMAESPAELQNLCNAIQQTKKVTGQLIGDLVHIIPASVKSRSCTSTDVCSHPFSFCRISRCSGYTVPFQHFATMYAIYCQHEPVKATLSHVILSSGKSIGGADTVLKIKDTKVMKLKSFKTRIKAAEHSVNAKEILSSCHQVQKQSRTISHRLPPPKDRPGKAVRA